MNLLFLGHAFTIMLVYVWSRRNPYVRMNFFGLLNFQAPYLPWVLLGFSLLLGNAILVDLMGIAVGHIYYFLEDVFPNQPGGFRVLETPRFMYYFIIYLLILLLYFLLFQTINSFYFIFFFFISENIYSNFNLKIIIHYRKTDPKDSISMNNRTNNKWYFSRIVDIFVSQNWSMHSYFISYNLVKIIHYIIRNILIFKLLFV